MKRSTSPRGATMGSGMVTLFTEAVSFSLETVLSIRVRSGTVTPRERGAIFLTMDVSTRATSITMKPAVRALTSTLFRTTSMSENGLRMCLMVRARKSFPTAHTMKGPSSKVSRKAMATMYVSQGSTRESLRKVISTGKAHSLILMAESIKEVGTTVFFKVMASFLGQTATDTKVST